MKGHSTQMYYLGCSKKYLLEDETWNLLSLQQPWIQSDFRNFLEEYRFSQFQVEHSLYKWILQKEILKIMSMQLFNKLLKFIFNLEKVIF